jgi:hypothetical protein
MFVGFGNAEPAAPLNARYVGCTWAVTLNGRAVRPTDLRGWWCGWRRWAAITTEYVLQQA